MSDLNGVPKISNFINDDGLHYKNFRKELKPRFLKVWLEMFFCFSMIIIPIATFIVLKINSFYTPLLTLISSIFIGFWIHAYSCFFHEAAHFNLHRSKKVNDLLSNIFITPFTGMLIKNYRVTHWEHHKHLGTRKDTEISYQSPLSIFKILEIIFCIYHLKVIYRYLKNINFINKSKSNTSSKTLFVAGLFYVISLHFIFIYFLIFKISIYAGLAWALGLIIFYPIFAFVRQTLEHRPFGVNSSYQNINSEPINRIFGMDFLSRFFGAAGFNRHLIHHYDPSISYTRFDDFEKFLLSSPAKSEIDKSKTSYLKTFFKLVSW